MPQAILRFLGKLIIGALTFIGGVMLGGMLAGMDACDPFAGDLGRFVCPCRRIGLVISQRSRAASAVQGNG